MRKKQFEKIIPTFEGVKAGRVKKDYMVDAFVKDEILAIDFYKSVNGVWKTLWRTLISNKDFCNYDYGCKCWNEKQVNNMMNECRQVEVQRNCTGYIIGKEVREIIEEYIKKSGGSVSKNLEYTVLGKIRQIAWDKSSTAEMRKEERIQKKMSEAPAVPRDFKQFIMNRLFKDDHLLYYTKDSAFCSRCGRTVEKTSKMRHNVVGSCPVCRKRVRFKSIGLMSEHDERKEVLLIQKHGDEVILRYFACSLLSTCKSKESLHYSESVRTYHKNRIEHYMKRYICYRGFLGDLYWSDKMNAYHQVCYGVRSCMYAGNYQEIADLLPDNYKYLIPELAERGVLLPWKDILRYEGYRKTRDSVFEKMYKAGLKKLAVEYVINEYDVSLDSRQRELKKILKISKPMLRYMQKNDSNKKALLVLQDAHKNNFGLNDSEVFELVQAGIEPSKLEELAEKQKIIKLLHYLQRVKGYGKLKSTYEHYRDYVSMAETMQYDFANDTVRYPKDLKQAHDKATMEFYQNETDNRKRKAIKENPNISRVYTDLVSRYGWVNGDFIICPPKNAGEIIEEGRTLHHCVGGDNYLHKHNKGITYILFMRNVNTPEEPYYTLEIDPSDNKIIQYYGKNDKKPDKEIVDAFLNKWKMHLKQVSGSRQCTLVG